jgi:nucleotide-binding universal stress UspA family protein
MSNVVVVGYVASAEGEAAVRQGIVEAALREAKLVVVYSEHPGHDAAVTAEHAERFAHVREVLEAGTVPFEMRHIVPSDDPVHDVLEAATQSAADLIVIGIRRRSPVGKLVLGSHAQSILLEASIPVLAVKA